MKRGSDRTTDRAAMGVKDGARIGPVESTARVESPGKVQGTVDTVRRARIERMARLARAYRGWSSTELNAALGRENTRIAPPSGIPKLDLIARLAHALDWELGDVAERLWGAGGAAPDDVALRALPFAELDVRAQADHRAGRYLSMEQVGRAMRAIARTPRERAIAANRLAGAYDGVGRYERVLDSVRAGLAEQEIGADIRLMLTINLANVSYTLWNLHETRAIAESVLERWTADEPRGRLERVGQAFARLLRGQARRRSLEWCESQAEREETARGALIDLTRAEEHYARLHADFDDPQYHALAHTARGAAIEARVSAGELGAEEALERVLGELDAFVDLEGVANHAGLADAAADAATPPSPHLIESAGWWAVFGANIAARAGDRRCSEVREHASRRRGLREVARSIPRDLDQTIAICTNKAAEVSELLDHWPMRERAFTLEWRRQSASRDGVSEGWTLDADDVRALVGTMGRLPFFRPTGWAILDRAVLAT